MKKLNRKISLIVAMAVMISLFGAVTAFAAEPTASLRAAICGSTHDFRSSQLMEVVTEGFSENATLQYTYNRDDFYMRGILGVNWWTELYPYFFSFSSTDMFTADEDQNGGGTDEPGRLVSDYKYFALSSRCWYDNRWYNMTAEDMADMTLTITVRDTNRQSSTYNKTATVSYTGFLEPDLETDIDHVAVALFEGESMRILDALGHAGVTHITCDNADVNLAVLEDESIANVEETNNVYYIEGIKTGQTRMEIKVVKTGHCAMHSDQEADSIVDIRVFKRPEPTPTTTTITLTNLEEGVSYTIDGVTKVCEDVNVPLVYTDLTPDTDYTVYVAAEHSFEENGETYHHSAHASVDTRTLVEEEPTEEPTEEPSEEPTEEPSEEPTEEPTELPDYKNDYAYIFGYNDAVMGAEGPLLRCELSAMVHRLVKQNGKLGDFVYDASNPSFDDIEGQWFQSGIEYMNHKGALAEGASAQPYVEVTRGEAFKYICLGLGFVEDATLTNQEYADFLYNAGYIIGDGSGDLKVDDLITRAEFCTMYNRIIGREDALLIDTDGNEVTAETYGFTDMTDKSVWYYENMVRATSAYEGEYVSIEKRGIRNVLDDYAG
ncbi:MAG: PT domain-containing protein [Clostridia bacterium]|nr:PT domain-containing protein [Clostridia bacterium]